MNRKRKWVKVSETSKPYDHANRKPCCCGNPDCTDFEERMFAWGIPLDELTEVNIEFRLR